MDYVVDIKIEGSNKRTYNISANTPEEAKEKLLLRLPPNQHEKVTFLSINPDPKKFIDDDFFGTFQN